jgi:hypothetical protein
MEACVSGRAFLGLISLIKEQEGPQAIEKIIAQSGKLLSSIFSERIRVLSWHPYEPYVEFLCILDRTLGKGDYAFCRQLGKLAGKHDLVSIFKVFTTLASPERFVRNAKKFWDSYFRDAGRLEGISWEPDNTVFRVYDFPRMHPAHCALDEGWFIGSFSAMGFEVHGEKLEVECTHRGGPYHEFLITWSPLATNSPG